MSQRNSYERPVIIKLASPLYAKHGASSRSSLNTRVAIDGAKISDLCKQNGSPLFVFSEKSIVDSFRAMKNAFESRYPKVKYGWSYKTNYLKAVCAILHREGAIAEVVSEFEYDKARAYGVAGKDILFNGPYKTPEAIRRAVQEGAYIHFDSLDEISMVEKVSAELNIRARVAVRINMNTGIHPQWSRFGFNLENGQAMAAIQRIASSKNLILEGLHCHIGTFICSTRAYETAAEKMAQLYLDTSRRYGIKLRYIDMGGGFASKSRLKGVYQAPEISVPSIDQYAEAITSALKKALDPNELPTLLLETGRHIIDESGYLISTVVARKLLPDGRRAYVLDAGVNLLYTSTWYRYNIELDGEETGFCEPSIIYGPLCMNIDVVDESIMLPSLKVGKRIILSPVGAYNVTQWMQFIQYRPAVVLVRLDGRVDVIRRREDLSAVEAQEQIPEDLKGVLDDLSNIRQAV